MREQNSGLRSQELQSCRISEAKRRGENIVSVLNQSSRVRSLLKAETRAHLNPRLSDS